MSSLPWPVLYQDDDILVFDKPAGVVVNEAETVTEPTLQSVMREWLPTQPVVSPEVWSQQVPADFDATYGTPEEVFALRQGLVHRLDKDTSGVVVWAKHPGSLAALLRQFREREVAKEYLCLVHGKFAIPHDTINLPLARAKSDRQKFAPDPAGRSAETEYHVLQDWPRVKTEVMRLSLSKVYQGFSLVQCLPHTGRTHQIRVHMAALRHPIVGDIKYVGRKRAKLDPTWCPRQFLHAAKATLKHPRTQQSLSFESPLPSDLQQVLECLAE